MKTTGMGFCLPRFAGSALACCLALTGSSSLAQSDEWAFEGSLYVFAADTMLICVEN